MNTVIPPEIDITAEVLASQDGSKEAFGRLMDQFRHVVFAIVLRRVRNRDAAEDVTQDVFLTAFRKIKQVQTPASFPGWIRKTAVRLAINHAMQKGAKGSIPLGEMGFIGDRELVEPVDLLVQQETRDEVLRLVKEELREVDRETLLAFYWDRLSLIEMGQKFNAPVGTIKRRLFTARQRLRDALEAKSEIAA